MCKVSGTKVILYILNVTSFVLGLAIVASSLWFFVQIHELTSLRNRNHYLLDYTIYWPQAIPWIFFIIAVFFLNVSCCGFASVRRNSRNLIIIYIICLGVIIVSLIAAAVIALVLSDDDSIEKFLKDIVWDAYSQMKTDSEIEEAFAAVERKLHCCGVGSPRDYKNWKDKFPISCCDGYQYGWLEPVSTDCEFSNKLANERHGCAAVAAQYAGITVKVLSGASIFTVVIAIISVVVAILHYPEL